MGASFEACEEQFCRKYAGGCAFCKTVDEFRQICYVCIVKTDTVSAALRRLEMSEGEQVIYLSLLREGRASARLLSGRTGLTRTSVYDQIKKLVALNLVVELEVEGKAHFAAADLKYLDALLGDKIDRLEQSRAFLAEALPLLKERVTTASPKIRFFEGEEGVKQILKDLMWYDHLTIDVVWPVVSMNQVFAESFLRWFDERRQLRQITARATIIGSATKQKGDMLSSAYHPFTHARDRVTYGADMDITMARIIYGHKVACISSQKEAFGFIVESAEFSALEETLFSLPD